MIYFLVSVLLKIYVIFNVLQKNYYEYKSVIKFTVKKFYILFSTNVAILLFGLFKHSIFEYLIIGTMLFQLSYIIKRSKVFLKVTSRIVRLLFTLALEIVLLTFFLPYLLIDTFIPILILLANVINKPIELMIKKSFIKKAIKKSNNIDAIKIAITGSYGKTSVKNYIGKTLKETYLVKYTPKSYNTPLGISKFINTGNFSHLDFLIYEFGARRVGDIVELTKYYDYDISIVTSIGTMHIDTFKNMENIIKEKMGIVKKDENHITILNYENEYIRNYEISFPKYTYGFNYGEFTAKNIYLSIFFSEFDLYIKNVFIKRIKINMLGRQAILNVMPSVVMCYLLNISFEHLSEIKSVNNRLSLRQFADYYILDDAYNSNIVGVKYALEVLKSYDGMKFIITPGLVEMDKEKEELTSIYSNLIVESVDVCILVDNSFTRLMKEKIKAEVSVYLVSDFKAGFKLFLNMKKDKSILLIENDLPDSF
mgnify:CR=1 FL=1